MHPFSNETHYDSNYMFLLKIDPYMCKTSKDQYIKSSKKKFSVSVGTWSKKLMSGSDAAPLMCWPIKLMNEIRQKSGVWINFRCGKSVWCGQIKVRHSVRCLNQMSRQCCSKVELIQFGSAQKVRRLNQALDLRIEIALWTLSWLNGD